MISISLKARLARSSLTIEEAKRFFGIMPAVTEEGMSAKLVSA
jgi:hypothetical protein